MKKFMSSLWVAVVCVISGCSMDEAEKKHSEDRREGTLMVRLAGQASGSRADLLLQIDLGISLGDAQNTLLSAENVVRNFSVYVFDQTTGFLEQKKDITSFANISDPVVLTGLNAASKKRVVVIANNNSTVNAPVFVPGQSYSAFNSAAINIDNVNRAASAGDGLLMMGETADVTITPGASQNISVPVSRVVSKVRLNRITIDPSVRISDLLKLSIDGVSVQRSVYRVHGTPNNIAPYFDSSSAEPQYVGGLGGNSGVGSTWLGDYNTSVDDTVFPIINTVLRFIFTEGGAIVATIGDGTLGEFLSILDGAVGGVLDDIQDILSFLSEGITISVSAGITIPLTNYFYVFPNPGTPDSAPATSTTLVVHSTWDGEKYYYPVEINAPDYMTDGLSPLVNGRYVERNYIYSVNLRIRNLAGATDPNDMVKPGEIEITITPQQWQGPIEQDVMW